MKRLVIAAPASGTGKTSIALGLMRAFSNRGLAVQPFKIGPDYIDTAFHAQACGCPSRNLDLWMMGPEILKGQFVRHGQNAELSLVEGVMGLFDGLGNDLENGSTAHVARLLEAPVVLVIDGRGVSTSAAAQVLGFKALDPRVKLTGVIVNQVSGEKHYRIIQEAVESLAQVPCYGYVEKDPAFGLDSRHLGLIPSVETAHLEEKLEQLARAVEASVDIAGLLALAASGPVLSGAPPILPAGPGPVRIGLAQDEAFNFYYEDNLDTLRALGAQLVPFSPVSDGGLPDGLGGLYIGGGFPEVFAQALSQNAAMLADIRRASQAGMPIFAECGGFMYLMEAIRDFEGALHPMVGLLPGTAVMTKRLQRFGYMTAALTADSIFGPAGTALRGHEFHRSKREGVEDEAQPAYRVTRARPPHETWLCGANTGNVLAAYGHIHWLSNPQAAFHYIEACHRFRPWRISND